MREQENDDTQDLWEQVVEGASENGVLEDCVSLINDEKEICDRITARGPVQAKAFLEEKMRILKELHIGTEEASKERWA